MEEVIIMKSIFKILLIVVLFTSLFFCTFCAFTVNVEKTGTIQTIELSTILLDDDDFLDKIQTLDSSILSVDKENDLVRAVSINDEYLTDNYIFSKDEASVPTYLWIDNGTIYYYTVATSIDLNIDNGI